jgi:flagellar basal body P-ring formation protein FlgA
MTRTLRTLLLCLPLALAPLVASGSEHEKPVLRLKAEVAGDVIRLGDIFENIAAEKAEIRIEQAPAPGVSVVIQPSQVAAYARMHGLDWKPQTYMDKVQVTRIGHLVPRATIDAALRKVLADKGVTGELEFEIASRAYQLYVSDSQAPTVAIDLQHYDPDSRSFIAEFRAPADEPRADRIRVAGRAHALVEVPILTRRMMANEVIRASDVGWLKIRSNASIANNAMLLEDVLGKAPKRMLQSGQPIRQADLANVSLIKRNDLVTMILRTKTMTLTAQGKALDDGVEGQTVKVQNPKSNRTVEGQVTGPNEVTVTIGGLGPVASTARPATHR